MYAFILSLGPGLGPFFYCSDFSNIFYFVPFFGTLLHTLYQIVIKFSALKNIFDFCAIFFAKYLRNSNKSRIFVSDKETDSLSHPFLIFRLSGAALILIILIRWYGCSFGIIKANHLARILF